MVSIQCIPKNDCNDYYNCNDHSAAGADIELSQPQSDAKSTHRHERVIAVEWILNVPIQIQTRSTDLDP